MHDDTSRPCRPPPRSEDLLSSARAEVDRRIEEIARSCAGHDREEVLDALERAVAGAAVMPSCVDLSRLAREIADTPRRNPPP